MGKTGARKKRKKNRANRCDRRKGRKCRKLIRGVGGHLAALFRHVCFFLFFVTIDILTGRGSWVS